MPIPPSKVHEHRKRVLDNLAKSAAPGSPDSARSDPQLRMPLLVEVKPVAARPRSRRKRTGGGSDQPDLGKL